MIEKPVVREMGNMVICSKAYHCNQGGICTECNHLHNIFELLADYLDTGLTPSEISDAVKNNHAQMIRDLNGEDNA